MKTLTKLLALLLVLLLVFSLAACQGGTSSKKDKDEDDKKVTEKEAEDEATTAEPAETPSEPEQTEEPDEPTEPSQEVQGSEVVSNASIVGKYTLPMTIDALAEFAYDGELDENGQMAMEFFAGAEPFNLTLDIAENTFTLSVDAESMKKSLGDAFLANLPAHLAEMMDMTDEELDAQLAASGMTREQFMEILLSQIDVEDLIGSAFEDLDKFTGVYRLEGDKLYVGEFVTATDGYLVVEYDAAKLIIKEVVGLENEDPQYQKLVGLLPWTFTKIG